MSDYSAIQTIPVVFACNRLFGCYATVTIVSLIQNSSPDKFYKLYILHSELTSEEINIIEGLSTKHVCIKCVDTAPFVNNTALPSNIRFPKETYYRVLIPEIFKDYDKIIYLDSDIVLLEDIALLYNIDIGNNIFGAIVNPASQSHADYCRDVLHIDYKKYFNSGVLLFNNKAFRENRIQKKFFQMLEKAEKYRFVDQDLLNVCCSGKVKLLDIKWNYMWQYDSVDEKFLPLPEFMPAYKQCKSPAIIHYTTAVKPWNSPDKKLADIWWKYAKKSPYYQKFQKELKTDNAVELILSQLRNYHIEIKNAKSGKNLTVNGNDFCKTFQIEAENSGMLSLCFKSPEKRFENDFLPLKNNYTSIKIDSREILSAPVETRHDKPFVYNLPVREGQIVVISFEQQYHQYSKWELQKLIFSLNVNNPGILNNIVNLRKKVEKKIKRTKLSDCFSLVKCLFKRQKPADS